MGGSIPDEAGGDINQSRGVRLHMATGSHALQHLDGQENRRNERAAEGEAIHPLGLYSLKERR